MPDTTFGSLDINAMPWFIVLVGCDLKDQLIYSSILKIYNVFSNEGLTASEITGNGGSLGWIWQHSLVKK